MSLQFTPQTAIASIGFILNLLLCFILLFYKQRTNASRLLLAATLFCIGYILGISILHETRLMLQVPHFYRTGLPFCYAFMPLSWLYIRTTISKKRLNVWDSLHFLPVLIVLIDLAPFYMQSAASKHQTIVQELGTPAVFNISQSFLFVPGFHFVAFNLVTAFYWTLQTVFVWNLWRRKKVTFGTNEPMVIQWVAMWTFFEFFLWLPGLFAILLGQINAYWSHRLNFSGLMATINSLYLLLSPKLLYGITTVANEIPARENPQQEGNEDEKNTSLTAEHRAALKNAIDNLMAEKKVFLQQGYALKDLSEDLAIPAYRLSAYLNRGTGMNFNDFLNNYRIGYCIDLLEDARYKSLTLEALAEECGFTNRNTFRIAFKKAVGQTPSKYVRGISSQVTTQNGTSEDDKHSNSQPGKKVECDGVIYPLFAKNQ